MKSDRSRLLAFALGASLLTLGAALAQAPANAPASAPAGGRGGRGPAPVSSYAVLKLSGDTTPVHDPSLIKLGGTYYLYAVSGALGRGDAASGPQIEIRTSTDLKAWKKSGSVFDAVPGWIASAVPGAGLWSPDVHFFNGKYWLYYAASSIGSTVSAIGVASNDTLDPSAANYKWEDHGLVLKSGPHDRFNAVDPSLTVDLKGQPWLVYGSFGGGIAVIKLDAKTGKPAAGAKPQLLATRPIPDGAPNQIEAPFVLARGGMYYLFASFDMCCGGANANYYTAIGRAKAITGPYLDSHGRSLAKGYGTTLLRVMGTDPGKGPGGGGVFSDGATDYFVYQANDGGNKGAATLMIVPLAWGADGWPAAVK